MTTLATVEGRESDNPYNSQSIFSIPKCCAKLARILVEQPLFDGRGAVARRSKVIPLKRAYDARICSIFNENTIAILGEQRAWKISSFGFGSHRLVTSGGKSLNYGLFLNLYETDTLCSVEELEETYNQVLNKLISGWDSATIEENPGIMFKEDPENFHLYIKRKDLIEEAVLIRFLATKFSVEEHVTCCSDWWTREHNDKIYLWIKKTAFEEVVSKFGFKFRM